jgi:uncharacterized protein (UPF0276 family)
MLLAVNYSAATADLLRRGAVSFDAFKVPAWPDLAAQARAQHPTYVHFPLIVGAGLDDALDGETNAPADWGKVERLLSETDTRFVNVHLAPAPEHMPHIPAVGVTPEHVEAVAERMLDDLRPVVARFGADRVIAENDQLNGGQTLRAAYLPEVITAVIEETGCGLLLDLSHARIAADVLGMSLNAYLEALPLSRLCDLHVTGVQVFDQAWAARMQGHGITEEQFASRLGSLQDHLPMTDPDWEALAALLDRVHRRELPEPWTVTFEYGGVGPLWEAVTDADILTEQIPRLKALVRPVAPSTEIGSS